MSSRLFSPLPLRELQLANRIVVSPMCQYSAEHGCATDWHLIHLGSLALSGAGLLVIEATAVTAEGRITPGCLGLWNDDNARALQRVLQAVRRYSDIPIAMQLAHAGRKASSQLPWKGGQLIPASEGGWQTVAPSALPQLPGETPPVALTPEAMATIREAFVTSARRAAALGVDALELHCAHGYLLHQFLSPLANNREDAYGGSLDNRMRYPLEVFAAVRDAWPAERPLGVRLSATDWVEGGWDIRQSIALCHQLKSLGCDWFDVSTGGVSPRQQIPVGPGFQVPFSAQIREAVGGPTMTVGLITDPAQAEAIIADGNADLVALARGMLWNPHWPWQAAGELGGQVSAPPQYWRAPPREFNQVFPDAVSGAR